MSELTHEGATRLIYQGHLNKAEQDALHNHLRSCESCRQTATLFGILDNHLVLKELPTRPSPQFTAVYREKAARRTRRSQIMKPVYAVGGVVALALIVLAGWFILRPNLQATTIDAFPTEPVIAAVTAEAATETAVPLAEAATETAETEPTKLPPTEEPPAAFQTYEIGEDIWGTANGDLNGDGYPDLALGDIGSDTVILMFNRGDGTFEKASEFSTGENPYGTAAADLDGDTDLDLVVAHGPDGVEGHMSVLLNNGDGTFQPQVDYPTAFDAWWPTPLDVDGDGDLDLFIELATAESPLGEAGAGIWTNNGDGTFEEGERILFGLSSIGNVVPQDMNNDGSFDLVIRNWPDPQVSVLLGNGDGSYGERADYEIEERTFGMAVADLNNDEFADVVTTNYHGIVSVLFNDGEGALLQKVNYEVGGEIWNVEAKDFTDDNSTDLLVGATEKGMASLMVNDGSGGFELVHNYYFPGAWATFFETADMDGDGHPELLGFNEGTMHIFPLEVPDSVVEQLPTAESPAAFQTYEIGEHISDYAFDDLNGDNTPDLAVIDVVGATLTLLFNRGDGTFEVGPQMVTGENPVGVIAADLDGDEDSDMVVAYRPLDEEGAISVLINDGEGSFQPAAEYPTDANAWWPTAVDVDDDGDLDLIIEVASVKGKPYFYDFLNPAAEERSSGETGAGIWINNGDGTFEEGERTDFGLSSMGELLAEDLNGDSIIDLVVRSWPDPQVSVLLGNGDGSFGERLDYEMGEPTHGNSVAVEDTNGDGFADVISVNSRGVLSVLFNNGEGAFLEKVNYDIEGGPWNLAVKDITGDSVPDLLIGPTKTGMASLLTNDGDGSFELTRDYYFPGAWVTIFSAGDVDGDGHPELIGFDYEDGTMHVFPLEVP